MIKFAIVTFPDPERMVKAVNGELRDGWELRGNIATCFDNDNQQWFTQVLTKHEPASGDDD